MKQKSARTLLQVAATMASAIIGSRQPSASGVSVEEAVVLLERVMRQLETAGLDGANRKETATDRQPVTPKPPKERSRKAAMGKQPKHDKAQPISD